MRMTRLQRVVFLILGLGAVAGAVALILQGTGGEAVTLIIAAVILLICGTMGAVPNINLKEGGIDFKTVEPVGGHVSKVEFDRQRMEINRLVKRIGYLLAHQPAPDDGMTDEDRLWEMRQNSHELEGETASATYHGEGNTVAVANARDLAQMATDMEERRQQAQFDFGLRPTAPTPDL